MIAGYKTITWCAGVAIAVLTCPEVQAWVIQHPALAFWLNNIGIVVIRHFTVAPLPWMQK